MTIKLYNTLSRQEEAFQPIDARNIRMYVCGPTVYDRPHIGNARSAVVFDVLYRLLCHEFDEPCVKYVRNITDVDDKIMAAALERGEEINAVTEKMIAFYREDTEALGVIAPTVEPRATEHIDQMKDVISALISRGHAYAAAGHVLFDVESDSNYGVLSRRSRDEMIAGSRVEVAPYKKNPGDFVLWKPSTPDQPGWESDWGRGRPGWHIECSAMSMEYLGHTFDIHGGGADLMFPHHENEIAQSVCSKDGAEFARYWVHNGFLTVNGEKMSKSLGNFITVRDLLGQGVRGEVIRYAFLTTHYRKPLDWSDKLLADSKKTMDAIYRCLQDFKIHSWSNVIWRPLVDQEILSALQDDLNVPKALARIHGLISEINAHKKASESYKDKQQVLWASCSLLGIFHAYSPEYEDWFSITPLDRAFEQAVGSDAIKNVEALAEQRRQAKADKNWAEADRLRGEIMNLGYIVEDKPGGAYEIRKS